jgi:hypothetical protein
MLRVLQMFIANYLYRQNAILFKDVIKMFQDNEMAAFSIQTITAMSKKIFNKK